MTSRPKRRDDLVNRYNELADQLEALNDEVRELTEEYQDWRDNLPENLEGSALAEKLEAMADLDPDDEADPEGLRGFASTLEEADLPLGFGRD